MSISSPTTTSSATPQRRPVVSLANWILAGLLVFQIVIAALVLWPAAPISPQGALIFGDITPDQVTAITITDDADRTATLEVIAGLWTLAGTDGYPANAQKITTSLQKLLAINTDRLVTRTEGSHNRLQVSDDNYLRKIDVSTSAGTRTIYLGSSGGTSATHVRPADQDSVFLSSGINTWELDPSAVNWIDVTYFATPAESIESVTLENANGEVTLTRDADNGAWTMADLATDETVAVANIDTFVARIATLNLYSVLGKRDDPAYGFASPQATITVRYLDDTGAVQTATLVVGAKDDATDTYYLKSSASDYYVRMAAFTGDEFVNQQRAGFLVQPGAADGPSSGGDTPGTAPIAPGAPSVALPLTSTDTVSGVPSVTVTLPLTSNAIGADAAFITPTSTITPGANITASTTISSEIGN